jgi:hypothetical protein
MMRKQFRKLMSAVIVAAGLLLAGRTLAGNLDPTSAPGPTMHSLEEIYQIVAVYQTLSATTTVVQAGNYAATNLTQVETDLLAENIKTNVTVFGIAGTLATNVGGNTSSAAVPKTGQTYSYQAGDDGAYTNGVASPNPRFTVQADTNCVLDNLTGLMWARNANLGGQMTWTNAVVYCEGLNYGGQTDWRLPNVRELQRMIDFGTPNALPTGNSCTNIIGDYYWSSTTYAANSAYAYYMHMNAGYVGLAFKTTTRYVWPVRGGP